MKWRLKLSILITNLVVLPGVIELLLWFDLNFWIERAMIFESVQCSSLYTHRVSLFLLTQH